jgi:hypothetical protein
VNAIAKTFEHAAILFLAWKLFRFVKGKRLFARLASMLRRRPAQSGAVPMVPPNSPFDPQYPLLWLSDEDPFRLTHAFEGVHIFGGNGSGKTSGPGQALLKAYMRAGMGGLILTAKGDEYETVKRYAEETGRLKSLIRFCPESPDYRFNFLAYLQRAGTRGGGRSANIVKTLIAIQDSFERGEDGGAKQEKYWKNVMTQLLHCAVDLALLARPDGKLSVEIIHEIITSAPIGPAQVDDPEWQATSLCYRLLDEALNNEALTPRQRSDLKLTGKFWLSEFPNLPHDTRGSAVSTVTTVLDVFLRGDMAEIFSTDLTIVPEMTLEGAIWVVDLPVKLFGQVGLAAQILIQHIWAEAIERRDVTVNPRPVFLWADESHNFVNAHYVGVQTTARSSRLCTVYLSQTLPNYYWALGGEQKGKALTESLMGVMQTKIFCANSDPKTNAWASEIFAKSWQQKANSGVSLADKGGRSMNSGSTESLEHNVEPAEFTGLRKGGPQNNFLVSAIIHGGGRRFRATGQQHLKTTFNQKD